MLHGDRLSTHQDKITDLHALDPQVVSGYTEELPTAHPLDPERGWNSRFSGNAGPSRKAEVRTGVGGYPCRTSSHPPKLAAGGQVPETAEQEATNVLGNIKSVLETAGLTMDDLVVVQVYASDVGDYGAFNSVYRTYFTTEFPARAFLGSGTLLFGARFEVMGIAVRREAAESG